MNRAETVAERAARMAEVVARYEREQARRLPQPAAPGSSPHWSETDREDDARDPALAPLVLEMGDRAARRTASARLRALLADGAWHSAIELVDVGGLRYGGRLHEIRRGLDGAPALDVEAEGRPCRGRTVWWYRRAPTARGA